MKKHNQQHQNGDVIHQNDDVTDIDFEEEESEMEKLEEEVRKMADKLKEYRSTLPDKLKSSLSTLLASQRPILSLSSQEEDDAGPTEPGTSGGPHIGTGDSNEVLPVDTDAKTGVEVELLRANISNNISIMPSVLKRMKDCISRIDKLVSSNETIHPVFKRNKR